MGFIMDRGPGTDEILEQLHNAFYLNVEATAADFLEHFDDNKNLLKAAINVGVRPKDPKDLRKWKKWLRWLFAQQNAGHESIRKFIKQCLTATPVQPIIFDWQEDQGADEKTPPVVATDHVNPTGGRKTGVVIVTTCRADKLP